MLCGIVKKEEKTDNTNEFLTITTGILDKKNMNKIRIGILILAIFVICGEFIFVLDFNELSWSKNVGPYLTIISGILLIVSMIFSIKHDKKKSI